MDYYLGLFKEMWIRNRVEEAVKQLDEMAKGNQAFAQVMCTSFRRDVRGSCARKQLKVSAYSSSDDVENEGALVKVK